MFDGKQVWVTAPTDYSTTDKEGAGRVRWVYTTGSTGGPKGFRWVYNNTGVAMVAGRAYFHGTLLPALTTGDHPTTLFEEVVTLGQSGKGSLIGLIAGIAMSAVPIANYGWVQIYGYNSAVGVEGTTDVALGDSLKGVSGQTYLVQDAASGTAPTNGRHLIALLAQAANSVVATPCFINCV